MNLYIIGVESANITSELKMNLRFSPATKRHTSVIEVKTMTPPRSGCLSSRNSIGTGYTSAGSISDIVSSLFFLLARNEAYASVKVILAASDV